MEQYGIFDGSGHLLLTTGDQNAAWGLLVEFLDPGRDIYLEEYIGQKTLEGYSCRKVTVTEVTDE